MLPSVANETIFARLAFNEKFQHTTLGVIVLNAMWISIDTEWNHKALKGLNEPGKLPLEPFSTVVENLFCVYFFVEVVLRFLAFKRKRDCFKVFMGSIQAWFAFDFCLVLFMVIETWILPIVELFTDSGGADFLSNFSVLRLLRLLRLTRMARLMRSFPELMTLIKGMVQAFNAVVWIYLLLFVVAYVFAILFCNFMGDPNVVYETNDDGEEEPYDVAMFGSMGDAMMSLFTHGVLGDNLWNTVDVILWSWWTERGDAPTYRGVLLVILFFIFFFISSMTLLNMLIGVLCDVVTGTAKDEKEEMQMQLLRDCIEAAFEKIDTNGDGIVTEVEWQQISAVPEVQQALECLGVEQAQMQERLKQLETTIFDDNGPSKKNSRKEHGLKLKQLTDKIEELRPDKPASALEVEMLRAKVKAKDEFFEAKLSHVQSLLTKLLARNGLLTHEDGSPAAIPVGGGGKVADLKGKAPASKIREIPTQLLFHELKRRDKTAQSIGYRAPYMTASSNHVSYNALRLLSDDLGN